MKKKFVTQEGSARRYDEPILGNRVTARKLIYAKTDNIIDQAQKSHDFLSKNKFFNQIVNFRKSTI